MGTKLSDAQMREPLFDYLDNFYGKIRILEEKNTGLSRADVIGITDDYFIGFEIKSDLDSYTRLKTQTQDYDALCDYNFLVIGKSHLAHAHEHIPGHWGILVVGDEDGCISVEMDTLPAKNTNASLYLQLSFLWRPELEMLLSRNGFPMYKQKSKEFVRMYLFEKMDPDTLKHQITQCLFERDYGKLLAEIDEVKAQKRQKRTAARKSRRKKRRPARTGKI